MTDHSKRGVCDIGDETISHLQLSWTEIPTEHLIQSRKLDLVLIKKEK